APVASRPDGTRPAAPADDPPPGRPGGPDDDAPGRAAAPAATTPDPAVSPVAVSPVAATHDGTATRDGAATQGGAATRGDDDELFPDPNAPRTPHAGTHVLGVLVGLVLAPLALALTLIGQSRVLVVQADRWDASLEVLGIVLVSCGVLLLAALLVLGLWTAAVPLTAGVVLSALGGLYLYAPGVARTTTLDVVGSDAWHLTLTQVTVAGTSGTALVAGVLLLAAGVVVALTRRHGVRLGAFRERNRTS
ncbi:hypothetical protein, partial [Cellulomonas sp. B6]|uniref:hypothetical protein n=1 Tax=Cellulomonas sp. B6 TaxID=1295626 RepID=UPI000B11AD31